MPADVARPRRRPAEPVALDKALTKLAAEDAADPLVRGWLTRLLAGDRAEPRALIIAAPAPQNTPEV